ncbi:unnamed protein product [Miscanthus lutarioriparius]|uniref:Uncharacterized protein n=1 Tax=Miscanthus lutarioriparius TaxID=422564 RepID=A0A811PDM7_9POAL|nr:unnamed protein product [Miscanthus lutarioriparius]
MATTITRLLHHLALFLLVVQFADAVLLPKTKNHAALKPQSTSIIYIVHANDLAKPPHFGYLEEWYHSMVTTHASSTRAASSCGILYTYDTVMHGFAVQLTGDEARLMSSAPGVIGVYKDRVLYPQTTRSTGFMGLQPGNGAWKQTDFGDGVIIGFIDTGTWPESASFNDSGLGPVRSNWRAKCVDAHGFNASLCNNKLVGAKAFHAAADAMAGSASSTHVASTAAGSEVQNASLYTFSQGTAWGMAPRARIAMYKACDVKGDCQNADILAAVDAAVKDGVDIISMSLENHSSIPFHDDEVAISTFGAERKGVFVVLGGGNGGPRASTVSNSAPASTVDRLFPAHITLGNGVVLAGQSLYTMHAKGTPMIQLVSTDSLNDWTPDTVMGKIIVSMDGASDADGISLQNAGGAGIVGVDPDEWSRDGSATYSFTLPGLTLSYTAGEKLRAYMASVASFSFGCETVIGHKNRAPVVAAFSSRGPNPVAPELLKPDVVAPGVNILAAWSGDAPLADYPGVPVPDGRRVNYNIISGTSMACPHVAGIAALIKKKHPSWTPAMVRSALMTTAATVDNRGGDISSTTGTRPLWAAPTTRVRVATPLVAGAGHVQTDDLGYDAGERDYVDFLCALNYTAEQMRRRTDVRTLTRTLTKVSEEAETYNVTAVAPQHVMVTVTPTTLEFKEHMETRSYSVEFRNEAGRQAEAGGASGRSAGRTGSIKSGARWRSSGTTDDF